MKKTNLLFLWIVVGAKLFAQYHVRFVVQENLLPVHDSIYITGYFNNWNPGDAKYLLKPLDAARKTITVNVPAGLFEFKFTRGSWPTVQKDQRCGEMENTRIAIHRDTIINATISTWMDECNTQHFTEVLKSQGEDTNKVNSLFILCGYENGLEKSLQYANEALALSKKINFRKGEGYAHTLIGSNYSIFGNYPEARKALFEAVRIQETMEDKSEVARTWLAIARTFNGEENYPEGQQATYTAIKYLEQSGDKLGMASAYSSIGDYESFNDDTSALRSYQTALQLFGEVGAGTGTWGVAYASDKIAGIYSSQGQYREALQNDSLALRIYKEQGIKSSIAEVLINIGEIFQKQGDFFLGAGDVNTCRIKLDDALHNYQEALKLNEEERYEYGIANSYLHLGNINIKLTNSSAARNYLDKSFAFYRHEKYKWALQQIYLGYSRIDSMEGKYRQAYDNHKLYILYRDSVNNEATKKKMVQTKMQYLFDKKEGLLKAEQGKKDEKAKRVRNQQFLAIGALALIVLAVLAIAIIQYRNNRQKLRANLLLQHQKEKVETTLSELKSTQAQLIQSEKMASLGELTAGIAHEIQNPLNFVNNFSEVSNELIGEMKGELAMGNTKQANAIANDLQQNLEKINHHGKRADAIVKGMLQHSRTGSGQKEATDINALADEYLRLASHVLKAKDNSFNVKTKTEFDKNIGTIEIVRQDVGKVILNLINNAFYAVGEKHASTIRHPAGQQYEPTVSVSTKRSNDNIEIRVTDNGNGISQKIRDKIFQPFFTTKPTGQGTGLGLSLAYDIVKAHGGEIRVVTKEGEGTEFIVRLSIK